jgi:hypothetical protein
VSRVLWLWRHLNPEIVFGFLIATVFWIGILGWQAAYAPTEVEKQKCYEAAETAGHKSEECKTLWERTTSDPVAFFTLWLVIFTGVLAVSTIGLWFVTWIASTCAIIPDRRNIRRRCPRGLDLGYPHLCRERRMRTS